MRRPLWIVVSILFGMLVLVVATDTAISSPSTCELCHEMQHRADSWKASAHSAIACVKCHVKPHTWYAYPQAFAARSALIARDISLHARGAYSDPVDGRPDDVAPMPDDICLQCHDPDRKATSGFRILIDHAEHAKRNGSCVSCHVRTAHPVSARGTALSLMGQCFSCHGTSQYAKASPKCGVCHPKGYELKPASHKVETWKREHGRSAAEDRTQCAMCHDKAFCSDCHGGIEMPHPDGWAKGATGHAVVAKTNRAVCSPCHGRTPDMCTMCHHTAFNPTRGSWVKQHFVQVEQEGSAFCMKCHAPTFCVRCHMNGDGTVSPAGAP